MPTPDDEALSSVAPPRKGRAAVFVAVPVAIVLILLVGVLFTRDDSTDKASRTPLQDKPAPLITGTTLDGKPFNLDQYRGKWVVVNFFASWCVPCQQEHPELLSFDRRHTQVGDAQLVSVVFNDDTETVRQFFAKNGGEWPVVAGDVGRIGIDYGVTAPPETFLIDPAGIVRARFAYQITGVFLDNQISAIAAKIFPTTPESSS